MKQLTFKCDSFAWMSWFPVILAIHKNESKLPPFPQYVLHQFLFDTQVFSSFLASFKSSRCHFICYWDNVLFWNSTHQSEAPLHNHCLHMIGRNTKSKQTLSLNYLFSLRNFIRKSEKWNSKRCFFSCEKRERGFVIIFYHRKVRLS